MTAFVFFGLLVLFLEFERRELNVTRRKSLTKARYVRKRKDLAS